MRRGCGCSALRCNRAEVHCTHHTSPSTKQIIMHRSRAPPHQVLYMPVPVLAYIIPSQTELFHFSAIQHPLHSLTCWVYIIALAHIHNSNNGPDNTKCEIYRNPDPLSIHICLYAKSVGKPTNRVWVWISKASWPNIHQFVE